MNNPFLRNLLYHNDDDDDDDEHNGEKVDFKDLLCGIEPSLPPAQPPLLVVDSATKTAFGSRDGGWVAVACLDQTRLSGRGWIWIKGLVRSNQIGDSVIKTTL